METDDTTTGASTGAPPEATAEARVPTRDDEQAIRLLVETWAAAVHRGDLAAVLRDHTDDIVMFDVPPPEQGNRGMAAYAASWPPFFEWQLRSGTFDVLELDVTVDRDVAFAWALLRCEDADDDQPRPDRRLRLTLGLRREDGRWQVAHEHHSFTTG